MIRYNSRYPHPTEEKHIDMLNEIFGEIALTKDEENAMYYTLCGIPTYRLENIMSAIKKVMSKG